MTQADKMAKEWAEKVLTTRWVDGEPFLSYIQQVAERTIDECQHIVASEMAGIVATHPWMKISNLRKCRWWEDEEV